MALRPSRNHCTAAPATKTLPSSAYCGGPSSERGGEGRDQPVRRRDDPTRPCGPAGRHRCRRYTWPARPRGSPGRQRRLLVAGDAQDRQAVGEEVAGPRSGRIRPSWGGFRAIFAGGTSNNSQRSSAHPRVCRSISSVREALVASVTKPPAAGQVPDQEAVDRPRGELAGLGAVGGPRGRGRASRRSWSPRSTGRSPGRSARRPTAWRSLSRSQAGAVRRSCQTRAGAIALPVARSQTIVVSRWLVRPMAAIRSALMPARRACAGHLRPDRAEQGIRVVLDPARLRVGRQDLGLALADGLEPRVVDDGPGAGRPLIDHQEMVARHRSSPASPGLAGSR